MLSSLSENIFARDLDELTLEFSRRIRCGLEHEGDPKTFQFGIHRDTAFQIASKYCQRRLPDDEGWSVKDFFDLVVGYLGACLLEEEGISITQGRREWPLLFYNQLFPYTFEVTASYTPNPR